MLIFFVRMLYLEQTLVGIDASTDSDAAAANNEAISYTVAHAVQGIPSEKYVFGILRCAHTIRQNVYLLRSVFFRLKSSSI